MTLTKRRIPKLGHAEMHKYCIDESLLTDDAFQPQTYTIRLEKGNFILPHDSLLSNESKYNSRYALRLAFDKSPYPPQPMWTKPGHGPDAMKMWEWKDFVGRESLE